MPRGYMEGPAAEEAEARAEKILKEAKLSEARAADKAHYRDERPVAVQVALVP